MSRTELLGLNQGDNNSPSQEFEDFCPESYFLSKKYGMSSIADWPEPSKG